MKKGAALLGSALFLVIAPGTVAGLVPWWISGWRMHPPLLGFPIFRPLGLILIAFGLPALLDSFRRFAVQGIGTPAPPLPTQHLVVTGLYRYVRNPMYVSVTSLIVGQGLFLGSVPLLIYACVVWVAFHTFVVLVEEPTLRSTYGAEYDAYCAKVPRWIPRIR